jgi:SM-20-related protein
MPSPEFFRKLGLVVLSDFMDTCACAQLRAEMREGSFEKGTVVRSMDDESVVDESIRRVSCAQVPQPRKVLVRSRLEQLRPEMEKYFQVQLTGYDGPHFLVYGPQAFYRRHQDASPGSPREILQRQVSVVIFLNAAAQEPAEGAYGGGSLTFYGLLQGPNWEKCPLPLDASPGLLVAFRPSVLHEVKPVTFGLRFTIVAWYTNESHSALPVSA